MDVVAIRLVLVASRLVPPKYARAWASSGARTVSCQWPVESVVTRVRSIQWSDPTRRPRMRTCLPATPCPSRVSRPEMTKSCHASAVGGVRIDRDVAALPSVAGGGVLDLAAGTLGDGAGVGAVAGGGAVVVEPVVEPVVDVVLMFASRRSCVIDPLNRFMSDFARMPATVLFLEYCQNVHGDHAPPKVVGPLP